MGKTEHSEKSKKKHKHKDRKDKKKSKKLKKHKKGKKDSPTTTSVITVETAIVDDGKDDDADFAIPLNLMNSKSHAPETPEEYQKRQSRLRREVDPSTGRIRLIKGDGEVLEEIVSKERHKIINTEATHSDGVFFQENSLGKYK